MFQQIYACGEHNLRSGTQGPTENNLSAISYACGYDNFEPRCARARFALAFEAYELCSCWTIVLDTPVVRDFEGNPHFVATVPNLRFKCDSRVRARVRNNNIVAGTAH